MEQITMVPLEQLHPHEKNPRIDAATVQELVDSIREHGIEIPLITAPQTIGDGYVVLAGHRRLTAALQLGLAEVPVQIRADLTDARDQLALMATENIHRDELTAVEESRLVQDMLDLGMSQAEVAKQTALGKKRVSERVKLGKLAEDTGEKVHRGQITVDEALIIAEYSDDPDAAERLERTAGTPEFDYKVSAARRAREDRQRAAASRKEAKKRGLRIAEEIALLSDLVREGAFITDNIRAHAADDTTANEWTELLISEHASCPGHSATILSESRWVTGHGSVPAGTLFIGCDQWEKQHPVGAPATEEPEHDPWQDLDAEDFSTAKIHRERHLAGTIPDLDVTEEAAEIVADRLVGQCWRDWGVDEHAVALLEAITGMDGKSRARRKLKTWPLPLLVWLDKHWYDLSLAHKGQALGRQGSSYWGEKNILRQLLDRTGYEWTPVEQQAILLATGIPHDATDDDSTGTDGTALAEGGDAA